MTSRTPIGNKPARLKSTVRHIVTVIVTALISLSSPPDSEATPRAAAITEQNASRELNFPVDVSIGRLVLLDKNFSLLDKHLVGKPLAEARGKVLVPVGKPIMLLANDALSDRASCLDKLPADALTAILLQCTEVGDEQIAHLRHLTGLRYADFRNTNLSDRGLASLSGLTNLGYMDISHTAIHGLTLGKLQNLKKLRFLNIGFNALDRKAFSQLATLKEPELEMLIASACGVQDSDLPFLAAFTSLHTLELTDSKAIDDSNLAALKALKRLAILDLRGSRVTIRGIFALQGLPLLAVTLPSAIPSLDEQKKLKGLMPGLRINFEHPQRSISKDLFAPLH
jgi:hypothetical protein